jgi:flagellar M-ring protein FliF
MAFNPGQAARQVAASIRGLSRRQQVTLASAVVLVTGMLGLFVYLMQQADYQTLYGGLSPEEAPILVQTLAARGIAAELSNDGTVISVPAGTLNKARLYLAAQGLPHSGRLGFEIFDKPNWAGSDFVEQVNYQRALEGELERTIEGISGMEAVRVHLAIAKQTLFSEQQHDSKAAVLVKLHPGTRLSDEDLNAITFLVSNAVDSMKPEDVRVIDAAGHVPLLLHGGTSQPQGTQDMESRLSQKLVDTLTPLVGANAVRASVTVEPENGSNETTQESYDTNDAVVLTSQTSTEGGSAQATAQGVPGSTSNVPQAKPQQPAQNTQAAAGSAAGTATTTADGSILRNDTRSFGVGKTIKRSVLPAGGIRRISAAVLVDDAVETTTQNNKQVQNRRKRTPDEMKQIEALASAAIGIDLTRGDKLAVENMSFVWGEEMQSATLAERIPMIVGRWTFLLRYIGFGLALILLYLVILRPLRKQMSASFSSVPALRPGAAPQPALAAGTPAVIEAEGVPPGLPEPNKASQIAALRENLSQRATTDSVRTSRVIQEWIRQH